MNRSAPYPTDSLPEKIGQERFWLALSLGLIALAVGIPDGNRTVDAFRLFLFVTGSVLGALMFFEWIVGLSHRHLWALAEISAYRKENGLPLPTYEKHNLHPPEEAPPPAPAAPAVPRVPFAPVSFVTFIWDWYDRTGKFPTVDECVTLGKMRRQMVQDWYHECIRAGAVMNRIPTKAAGDPSPGWDRARFLEAAKAANSL